jgi:Zn-dependent protease with chaperone function
VAERLSPEHVAAIIAHEEAHILFGHVDDAKKLNAALLDSSFGSGKKCESSLAIVDLKNELAADAYASSIHGKKTVREALLATLQATFSLLIDDEDKVKEAIELIKNEPVIRARLAALDV